MLDFHITEKHPINNLLGFVVDDGEGFLSEVQHVREVVEWNNDNPDHHLCVGRFPERVLVLADVWKVTCTFERLVQFGHVHLSV